MTTLEFKVRTPSHSPQDTILVDSFREPTLSPSLRDETPELLRRDDFLMKRADLEGHIAELSTVGGDTNPWLSNSYLELSALLVGESAASGNNKGLLHEAEGFLLTAYEVATINGDTQKRIESLEELSLVTGMLGNQQLSEVLSNQAEALFVLNEHLNAVPYEQRLRYEHPAIPTRLSTNDVREMKKELQEVLREFLPEGSSEYEVASAAKIISSQLQEAASQGRWVDDLLVLDIAEGVDRQLNLGISILETAGAVKQGLPVASNYIDLGLHERTLAQLSSND